MILPKGLFVEVLRRGYTTPVESVRMQLRERHGGTNDSRLLCVVTTKKGKSGKFYRLPTERDLKAIRDATTELKIREKANQESLSLTPEEPLPIRNSLGFRIPLYGMLSWRDLFTSRQTLSLITLVGLIKRAAENLFE